MLDEKERGMLDLFDQEGERAEKEDSCIPLDVFMFFCAYSSLLSILININVVERLIGLMTKHYVPELQGPRRNLSNPG